MWIRMRLDIDWFDILSGALYCCLPSDRSFLVNKAKSLWRSDREIVITHSVRSGFDLLLRTLDLPPGSEIMMTALTIPDMPRIVEMHGLIPVPVDIDRNGHINLDSFKRSLSPRTRMLVVAHLFGDTVPLQQIAEIASERQILLVEDFAQGYCSIKAQGHDNSDVLFYSFGPIKTATALGGGVAVVRSKVISDRMIQLLDQDPIQSNLQYLRRLVKFSAIKLVSGYYASSLFKFVVETFGGNFNAIANNAPKGFRGAGLLKQLRRQPSSANIRMMVRRWKTYDFQRIKRRQLLGKRLDQLLNISRPSEHAYWGYSVQSEDPKVLMKSLIDQGFDATQLARMSVVRSSHSEAAAEVAQSWLDRIVILPFYPEMTDDAVARMASTLVELDGTY